VGDDRRESSHEVSLPELKVTIVARVTADQRFNKCCV
jgi:hypothetical protein